MLRRNVLDIIKVKELSCRLTLNLMSYYKILSEGKVLHPVWKV